ncbi:MAG TPA: S46 family peptidase, partial [Tenuifilaceae bacterium]|nr:S46 family peptidase [Tenuifilaceae bacterium]
MKRILLTILVVVTIFPFGTKADEGMWLPMLISKYNIAEMQQKGFKLTADDVYSINQPSMKDAIVIFGRGCTGELISPEGLLITNHHCGYGAIQRHSSVEHDYLSNGFWAMSKEEELPNPGLTVRFLVRMDDVTNRIISGIPVNAPEDVRDSIVTAISQVIIDEATSENHYTARVAPMFYGNQYFLFIYEEFLDVRLVGAPPSDIGKFGGDTDNWMWPRHTGDFSLFRIYADKDNKPAAYSPDNVPYTPKRFLPISLKGVNPGDFTMVYGYPGSTQQFITSQAVKHVVDDLNPLNISLRDARLRV